MSRTIRIVKKADYPQWLRLRKMVYSDLTDSFHQQEMKRYDQEPEMVCFLAWENGYEKPIGFIEVSLRNVVDGCLTDRVGYLEGLYVDPEHRGREIGRSLIERANAWFKTQGCSEVATDALADDYQAQAFHLKMGFRETYRIVQFKKELEKGEQ